MDSDKNPDRLLSEPPLENSAGSVNPHNNYQTGGTSATAAPINASNHEDDVSPLNGDAAATSTAHAHTDPHAKIVHDVVHSEIGISTLLNRLKQSIASAKEFASFLKERSILEEKHSNGLKKLCKTTSESIRRPDSRHGSFLQSYDEVTNIHDRMAENGAQFALSLHQMHEDLQEIAANMEKGRKHWKATGLQAEQRVVELEAAMRKSKTKYDGLAEDYDRARTGDRQGGKLFGLKGPKSAAQHEEDLMRKVQAADSDYATKVQTAQGARDELWSKMRPDAVRALQDLIKEVDSAVTMQMQKFASFNEKLLLSNGLNISPMKGGDPSTQHRSLREAVHAIDNEKDLNSYITSFANKVPPKISEIKYERNAVLNTPQPAATQPQRPQDQSSFNSRHGPHQSLSVQQSQTPNPSHLSQSFSIHGPPHGTQQHERSVSQGPSMQQYNSGPVGGPPPGLVAGQQQQQQQQRAPSHGSYNNGGPVGTAGPPQLSSLPFQNAQTPPVQAPSNQAPYAAPYAQTSQSNPGHLPPLKPVFGLSLDQLFERDGSAVPMVVYQCIQAVDLFGLEVEGIYRLSGTASHITNLKAVFDNDSTKVDFRNPESFMHDVNSVAGLLKQFFRDLPDPLLTSEHYAGFIEASKSEDEVVRRDSLHAIINSLPDPNYATLRALTLHLHRVQESSGANRMNASNLAIVFGPTLMGTGASQNIQDAGWQVKVIDVILQNTLQIFDDD